MPKLLYPEVCPECGFPLSRSRRRGPLEAVMLRLLRIKAFRCHRCCARFYSPPAVIFRANDPDEPRAKEFAAAAAQKK